MTGEEAGTIGPPALSQLRRDVRLTPSERTTVGLLWRGLLSPEEYRPLKSDVLALLQGIPSASASRNLRRLKALGYLVDYQPDPRAPRLFLLVNVIAEVPPAT